MAVDSYSITAGALEPPTVSVHINTWSFSIELHDSECMVVAHDGDTEIIGSSIQEVVYGVLTEHALTTEVIYLRRNMYSFIDDLRIVLWSLADDEDSPYRP